jgi:hypothetical protein
VGEEKEEHGATSLSVGGVASCVRVPNTRQLVGQPACGFRNDPIPRRTKTRNPLGLFASDCSVTREEEVDLAPAPEKMALTQNRMPTSGVSCSRAQ